MYVPLPIVVGAVALILVLLLVRGGRRSSRDLVEAPTMPVLSGDVEGEARALLLAGDKIGAIRLVRKRSGIGLKEAKDMVERMDVES